MKKLLITGILLCTPIVAFGQSWINYNLSQTISQSNVQQFGTAQPGAGQAPINGNLSYQPLEPLPSANPFTRAGQYTNLVDFLQTVYPLVVIIGSLTAVVILTIGGIRYMLAEAFTDVSKAKRSMTNALWGLLVLVGSFLIIYQLNPDLLRFNFTPPRIAIGQSQFALPSSIGGGANTATRIDPLMGSALDANQAQAALIYSQNNYGGALLSWVGQYIPSYTTVLGSILSGSADIGAFTSSCTTTTRPGANGATVRAQVQTVPAATLGTSQDGLICVI